MLINAGGTGESTAGDVATLLATANFQTVPAPAGSYGDAIPGLGFQTADAAGGSFTCASPINGSIWLTKYGTGARARRRQHVFRHDGNQWGHAPAKRPQCPSKQHAQLWNCECGNRRTLTFGPITAATLGGLSGVQNLTLTNAASGPVALSVGNNNQGTAYSGSISAAR